MHVPISLLQWLAILLQGGFTVITLMNNMNQVINQSTPQENGILAYPCLYVMTTLQLLEVKGEVFISPKLREVLICNFHGKAPKWVKYQAKGSKIREIRTKQPN